MNSDDASQRLQNELLIYVATSFTTTKDPLPISTKVGISIQYPQNQNKNYMELVSNEISTNQRAELYGIKRVVELNIEEELDLIVITRSQYALSSIVKLLDAEIKQESTPQTGKNIVNNDIIHSIVTLIRDRSSNKRVTTIRLADRKDRSSSISHKVAGGAIKGCSKKA